MMKKYLLLFTTGLSLAACKTTDEIEAVPIAIASAFDQNFSLLYRQQAMLSTASQPELTVEVTDLNYAFCPRNAYCLVANFVAPTLSVTDAQGKTQQLRLPIHQERPYTPVWIDTASVRANNQRYVFYYTEWTVDDARDQPGKKDITVTLRVTK